MPRAVTQRQAAREKPAYFRTARPLAQLRAGRTDWYRINRADGRAPEIFIYDEIGYFGVTAQDFVTDLADIDAPELTLRINSPGGEVFAAQTIYNALVDHPATVSSIVDGLAASAASFIAMAGETVIMNRHSEMMIHEAMGIAIGDAAEMREFAEQLERTSERIAGTYAAKAGGSVADWRAAMRAETWYTAQEAVDAGLADEARKPGKSKTGDEPTNTFDLSIYSHAGRKAAPAPFMPDHLPDLAAEAAELAAASIRELEGAFA